MRPNPELSSQIERILDCWEVCYIDFCVAYKGKYDHARITNYHRAQAYRHTLDILGYQVPSIEQLIEFGGF